MTRSMTLRRLSVLAAGMFVLVLGGATGAAAATAEERCAATVGKAGAKHLKTVLATIN